MNTSSERCNYNNTNQEAVYSPSPAHQNVQLCVVEQPVLTWVSQPYCWNNCEFSVDLGLCCYTTWCLECAWAEMMSALGTPAPCCASTSCGTAFACLIATVFAQTALQLQLVLSIFNAKPMLCLPLFVRLTPTVTSRVRRYLASKYGLSISDCRGPCCLHYWCSPCAVYQEALYVKHVLKKDFRCCCYVCCRTACSCGANPDPGDLSTLRGYQRIGLVATIQQQPQIAT